MTKEYQPDMFGGGRDERDKGISSVTQHHNEWMRMATLEADNYIQHPTTNYLTGEDIRLHVVKRIGEPHDGNCWGALTNKCIKAGWLRKTGMNQQMRLTSSHARSNPIYQAIKRQ